MRDPKKYRKMMLIIEQTLYDLGYNESAKMLEQESGVRYFTDELLEVRQCLGRNDFEAAIKVIEELEQREKGVDSMKQGLNNDHAESFERNNQQKMVENNEIQAQIQSDIDGQEQVKEKSKKVPSCRCSNKVAVSPWIKLSPWSLGQTKSMLFETYCMEKIMKQQYDEAMKIISENITNEQKKQFLCEALVLGNHHVTTEHIQLQLILLNHRKKQEIFKFCLSEYQDIGEKEIQKVIESYTQHQGEHNKQLKKLLSSSKKLPPIKLLASEFQHSIKHTITHIKMNPMTTQLLLIDEGNDFQQIFSFKFQEKNWQYQRQVAQTGHLSLKLKYPIFTPVFNREVFFMYRNKRQAIESVAFNYNRDNPLVAVGSYSIIQIFDSKLDVIASIETQNKIEKFLYLQFHPLSDLLYNCGYFEAMQILDTTGEQIASIYPYPKTRKFLFYKGEIVGISLVTNKLYKHSVDQQVLIQEKELDEGAIPMDLTINQKQDKLAVSSLQFLYVIHLESLEILGKTLSPTNPNKLTIEVKFYGQLLITLAKTFTCYQLSLDKTIQSPASLLITKIKEWSGEGAFDIYDQLMVSGAKEILCWQQADIDSMMEEESEFEEEIEDGNDAMRDVEQDDDQQEMVDDSQIDQSDQDGNDDSMEEEDDDDQEVEM